MAMTMKNNTFPKQVEKNTCFVRLDRAAKNGALST